MSAYKEIKTEFRNLNSLLEALKDMGYEDVLVSEEPKTKNLQMKGYFGESNKEAGIVIPASRYHTYEDTGFRWNGNAFEAIVSTHDNFMNFGVNKLEKLKGRYAYHEVKRQAKINGYSVQERNNEDGSIRLVLSRR